ncbi:hypothetical protein [Streptomyces chryseus]
MAATPVTFAQRDRPHLDAPAFALVQPGIFLDLPERVGVVEELFALNPAMEGWTILAANAIRRGA